MAGHSKFKNIMYRKGAQDKKRAKIFSRLGKEIAVFNSSGLLEIAMYRGDKRGSGNASTLLGLEVNAPLIIQFI